MYTLPTFGILCVVQNLGNFYETYCFINTERIGIIKHLFCTGNTHLTKITNVSNWIYPACQKLFNISVKPRKRQRQYANGKVGGSNTRRSPKQRTRPLPPWRISVAQSNTSLNRYIEGRIAKQMRQ